MRITLIVLSITMMGVLISASSAALNLRAETTGQLQGTHIDANKPVQDNFDRFLRRDLAAHFLSNPSKNQTVEYEFLRNGPTQSGVAYPKYYVWVWIKSGNTIEQEGAARVAAIDRKRFEVTNFLSKDEIAAQPSQIYDVFPGSVCSRIEKYMRHRPPKEILEKAKP